MNKYGGQLKVGDKEKVRSIKDREKVEAKAKIQLWAGEPKSKT